MKKLSYLILLAMLTIVSTPSFAQEQSYGIGAFEYTFDPDNVSAGACIIGYSDQAEPSKTLVIPSSISYDYVTYAVTSIDDQAFLGAEIESVTIPGSVKNIGDEAFWGCYDLISVTIQNGVESIGESAFEESSLTSITIPSSVTSIGQNAFLNCGSLTSLTISSSVTSIGQNAFLGSEISLVYFLDEKPSIGSGNDRLTSSAIVYVPLQYLDSYRSTNSGPIADEKLYPLLSPSTSYSTFSFDKDVDLSSITGLNNPANTLTAYCVSAVDTEGKKVTLSPVTGEVAAGEGIIIKGTGAEGEYYPIRLTATGETPPALAPNFMKGVGATATEIAAPSANTQRYFIMDGSGDFYYCTGGTLPKYKAYLDIVTPIAVGGGSSAKGFSIVFEDEESTGINGIAETKGVQAEAWYTIGGQRLQGKPSTKGLYIVNGKKVVIK